MAYIDFVAIQRDAHGHIVRRLIWQRWTRDLATAHYEPEPVRPELGAILSERVLRAPDPLGETWDALGAVWADVGRAGVNGALLCVLVLVFLLAAGRGL